MDTRFPRPNVSLLILAALAVAGALQGLSSQSPAKRPLDHDAYDVWNAITARLLSPDGAWLAYTVEPGKGDGTLRVKALAGSAEAVLSRGARPRFTRDSRHLIFAIRPMEAVVDSLKAAGKKGDALPKDSLGILDLRSLGGGGEPLVFRTERVKSFKTPEEAGGWVAYLLEKAPKEPPQDTTRGTQEKRRPEAGKETGKKTGGRKEGKKAEGTTLVLRNLETGEEFRFEDVTEYALTEDGRWLVYAASSKDGTADGVYAVATRSGARTALLTGKGAYEKLALAKDGRQAAFLTDRDDPDADPAVFTLYHARLGEGEARPAAKAGSPGIPEGWEVSRNGDVSFSEEGTRLFFGTAPRPEPEPEEVPEDEKVVVDIWNWKDPLIQPMQLARAERERKRTYLAYVPTSGGPVVQLGRKEIPEVRVARKGEGAVAIGLSTLPYGPLVSYDATYGDVYLVDVGTGEAERILEKLRRPTLGYTLSLSPGGRYLHWWDGEERAWYVMDVEERTPRNVTAALPYPVHDELDDHPQPPPPYGVAGWTEGDRALLVYDRFDVWSVDPSGRKPPRSITEGVGRREGLRFRYVSLDRDREAIPEREDLLLSAFHLRTKAAGFYRDRVRGRREPVRLLLEDRRFSRPVRAEDAEVLLFTRESFQEFPDLWVSGPDFRDARRVTDVNPQQAEYLWGTAELVEWLSADGIPLRGILYKPEGFDPSRKYPMMVYFYERMSDGLHRYRTLRPGSSSVIPTFYVSRGYVFFIPDIPYEIGHPGESAVDAVVPGVLSVVARGFVDPERIGVQGHSWGGYQIAYMLTRTNLFAAAEAGAPVANMVSAYGGIRWGTGMSRQFQYERTQSRIGGSLWEETLRYIENSPVFEADKIRTPLLMMHNDKDTAVPWYQGIEMFMALRRLGRPVWLLNYNGEPHGLRKEANRRDWAIRMQQFFDHYLKGAPAPVWMTEGVPAVKKGRTLGLEPADGKGR